MIGDTESDVQSASDRRLGIGLAAWAWWSALADWQMGRAPAATTFTKVHYAKRSDDLAMLGS